MFFNKKQYIIETAVFGEASQNCDYVSSMIITWHKNEITYYINDGIKGIPRVQKEKYWAIATAYQKYHEAIGRAIRGGWSLKELKSGTHTVFNFQYKAGTKGNWKGIE